MMTESTMLHSNLDRIVELGPVQDRTSQRDLVGIFNLVADGNPTGDDRDFYPVRRQFAIEEEIGRVALHRRAKRQNHLFHLTACHATDEALYLQVGRPDAVHRRNHAAQDVVDAPELPRILDRHHLANVFNHAHRRVVALRVRADSTQVVVANVVAHLAIFDLPAELQQRVGKPLRVIHLLPEQVERKAQRRLPPDPG